MKKLLALAGILGALMLTGCALTSAAADGEEKGDIVITEVDLQDGYYLSDKDDSYIHIDGNMIELCGFDIVGRAKTDWENFDGPKVSLEESIACAKEVFEPLFAWKEFTPIRIVECGENGKDLTLLVVDYEWSKEHGTYTGYLVNEDGTITREGHIYTYNGENLE